MHMPPPSAPLPSPASPGAADKRQFAAVSGGLLAWDFELKDDKGGTLALIDRNFSGALADWLAGWLAGWCS